MVVVQFLNIILLYYWKNVFTQILFKLTWSLLILNVDFVYLQSADTKITVNKRSLDSLGGGEVPTQNGITQKHTNLTNAI